MLRRTSDFQLGTLSKLQGEFKGVCSELDETKKRLQETEMAWKRLKTEGDGKAQTMVDEIQSLNVLIEKEEQRDSRLGG